jgi:hypothetical protein
MFAEKNKQYNKVMYISKIKINRVAIAAFVLTLATITSFSLSHHAEAAACHNSQAVSLSLN